MPTTTPTPPSYEALNHWLIIDVMAHIDDAIQVLPDGAIKDALRADLAKWRRLRAASVSAQRASGD